MAVTNQSELSEKMKLLRSHAITRDEEAMTVASEGGWYYQQLGLGFNYRMTDIHAAFGTQSIKTSGHFYQQATRNR